MVSLLLLQGAAYIVRHKQEDKLYIAKKILLEAMSDKEQEGAMMEVQLLKNLNHPNIVAYKSSYIDNGQMIIIMEYCEGKAASLTIQSETLTTTSRERRRKASISLKTKFLIGSYKFVLLLNMSMEGKSCIEILNAATSF
jgi:serine/threonine protein kinase